MAETPAQATEEDAATKSPGGSVPARRVLGRGLGALIPGADATAEAGVVEIPTGRIKPNSLQPRSDFEQDALDGLQASIAEHGVLQPVLVRPIHGQPGGYELIAGERRWRAAAAAGLKTIPAIIRHFDDRGALEAALVENLQREDLNPAERARAYRRLQADFGLTQEDIAKRVGRSQPSVANTLRLLALPEEVLVSLEAGRITEGHARALLAIPDRLKLLEVWRQIETRGMSVRTAEAVAKRAGISREIPSRHTGGTRDMYIIQHKLSAEIGARVRIVTKRAGSGEIRITFATGEDLARLIEILERLGRASR